MRHRTLGIVAGEVSGSILGAGLIHVLRQREVNLEVVGVGGADMIAAGCRSLYDMETLSVMGLIEVLPRLPRLFKMRHDLVQYFTQHKPAVFVGIDAPDFNLGLELRLRQAGIPTVHYGSPSVWAWRQKRIFKIAKSTDLVLTLFPFEAAYYEKAGVRACFVGHPLADKIPLLSNKLAARSNLQLPTDATYVALLPGSRQGELRYMSETFIKAAYACWRAKPNLRFITSAVNALRNQDFQRAWQRYAPDLPLQFFQAASHTVMAAADVALVTSGTVTLECLLFKCPMVIAYKMSPITYQIVRRMLKVPYIGLPNLLAGKKIVPEFIQNDATPENLAESLLNYLADTEKTADLQATFMQIHQQLRQNANERAADAVMSVMHV